MPKDSSGDFIDSEREVLAVHVDSCVRRHSQLNRKLTRIEAAMWAVLMTLLTGGFVTVEKLVPALTAVAAAAMK